MSGRVKPEPAKYKTTNWKSYNEVLKLRGALMIWLDRDLQWSGASSGKRCRTPTFSDAAIQFCLTIKRLFGLTLRQAMGMVARLLKLADLLCRYLTTARSAAGKRRSRFAFPIGPRHKVCTCWLIARG